MPTKYLVVYFKVIVLKNMEAVFLLNTQFLTFKNYYYKQQFLFKVDQIIYTNILICK